MKTRCTRVETTCVVQGYAKGSKNAGTRQAGGASNANESVEGRHRSRCLAIRIPSCRGRRRTRCKLVKMFLKRARFGAPLGCQAAGGCNLSAHRGPEDREIPPGWLYVVPRLLPSRIPPSLLACYEGCSRITIFCSEGIHMSVKHFPKKPVVFHLRAIADRRPNRNSRPFHNFGTVQNATRFAAGPCVLAGRARLTSTTFINICQ